MHDDTLERLFDKLAGSDLPVPPPGAVISRGRQRRRRARGQVLAGTAAAAALLGLAVGELTAVHAPAQSPPGRPSRPPAVCQARPDPGLSAELKRALPTTGQSGTTPIALSADGSTAYVLTTVGGFHGIAGERAAAGARPRPIESLPAFYDGVRGGLGPDGELVWTELFSAPSGWGSSTVLMWSPQAGTVIPLQPAGQLGHALTAPVFSGSVQLATRAKSDGRQRQMVTVSIGSNQLVAWVQSDDSQREIVEANLVTRTADVIATGYVGPPIFLGNALVWSVADAPGQLPTRLVAMNAAEFPARQRTGVPAALRGVSPSVLGAEPPPGSPLSWEVSLIASYDGAMAYFSAPGAGAALTELYYSPAPSQPARLVLRLSGADTFAPGSLALGAGYLGWSLASGASYVASTSSLAAAKLSNGSTDYSSVQAAGRFLIAASSPDPKQGSPRLSVLSGATIKGLACAPARTAGR